MHISVGCHPLIQVMAAQLEPLVTLCCPRLQRALSLTLWMMKEYRLQGAHILCAVQVTDRHATGAKLLT